MKAIKLWSTNSKTASCMHLKCLNLWISVITYIFVTKLLVTKQDDTIYILEPLVTKYNEICLRQGTNIILKFMW